jgi:L-Ala-D/L-Glu epimerase
MSDARIQRSGKRTCMRRPTHIVAVSVELLDIPLREPFGISHGSMQTANNVLVSVRLEDGTVGYGEGAPFPAFNGETQQMAMSSAGKAASTLFGKDVRSWRKLADSVRDTTAGSGSAQCALESALVDAFCRHFRLPMASLFGGASGRVETDMTIPTGTVQQAADASRDIVARGVRTIKIKVGGGDLQLDVQRVVAASEHAKGAPLLLDGNGAFSCSEAIELLSSLRQRSIVPALFEQPVPADDWDGLSEVGRRSGVSIAADESVTDPQSAFRLAQARAVHVINIKLMKSGIVNALQIAAIARAAGVKLMIGGMVESMLGMSVSACLAAGLGGFDFVDLDTPWFMAQNPFEGGYIARGGTLDLTHIEAGHGVRPTGHAGRGPTHTP